MPLLARFVDTIASSPTVRLNLNDGTTWRFLAESRLDPPPAKRARVSTLMTDGATYPASAYDDRTLDLRLFLQASTTDAVATQLQLLARELDRADNIFQYQLPGMTNPLFFRTQRLGFDAVDVLTDGGKVFISAVIPAEPFAYGLPQTLSQVVVTNDPAAGSNGMFFDVSSVLGDVETPLVLRINHADTVETWGQESVFAVRRRGTVTATPFFLQAESMTQFTDTTVQANDAVMSGAGSNYSRCTFATNAAMATRLSFTAHPSSASVDARGRYRVFLRYRKSVSGDSIAVRLQWGDSNNRIDNDTVTLPSGTSRRYVDLGDIQIPVGVDAPTDLTGAVRASQGVFLAVQAQRVSGSGNLDMDVLLFPPSDDRLAMVSWYAFSGSTYAWLDGVVDQAYITNSTGDTSPRMQTLVDGGMPTVSPGVTNRIFVVHDVSSAAASDDITNTMTIVPHYLPRYLWVRPAST